MEGKQKYDNRLLIGISDKQRKYLEVLANAKKCNMADIFREIIDVAMGEPMQEIKKEVVVKRRIEGSKWM